MFLGELNIDPYFIAVVIIPLVFFEASEGK